MSTTEFDYKGKHIVIREEHPEAVVSVDGREFECHHHHEEQGLDMWMCPETYFASPDIKQLARHFADYGYMFDDPGRIIVDDTGTVVEKPGHPHNHDEPREEEQGHEHGEGHDEGQQGRPRRKR